MSTFRNILFATGFMAVGAVSTVGLQAAARPGGFGHGPGAHLQRMIGELDLSAEQQAQFDEIKATMRSHHQDKRSERDARRGEMMSMLQADTLDRDFVHAEIDARAAEKTAFMHDMADQVIDLHATLDAEQKATLVENLEEAHDRMESRRQEWKQRRGQRGDL